jgi:gliding motility-associated-like protein
VKRLSYILGCLFFLYSVSVRAQAIVVDPGAPQKICPYIGVTLGGNPTGSGGTGTLTYNWTPASSLNNPSLANPTAYPLVTTTYTVLVSDGIRTNTGIITITVYNTYVNAGPDVTIQQGQTITLHAQAPGSTSISWSGGTGNMYNPNSYDPDVYPIITTTYTVAATFQPGGCMGYDEITVNVIKSNNLFFYNTFTPNADGSNDLFYIGNIEQYPDNVLEIYNRYGQKVFNKTGYQNDWDGKYLNDELPAGTYFYMLDTKSPSGGKHHGTVVIVR